MSNLNFLALLLTSSSSSNYSPGFPGGIVAWIVCYKQRRSQIGGWLLFYYWQLYGGILITLLFFAMGFQSYVPESFEDASLYRLFLLSVLPSLLLYAVEIVVGTMLLSVRSWEMVKLLRWVLMGCVVAAVLGLAIDSQKFPDNLPLDIYDLVGPTIWSVYFMVSKRVKHVFRECDWDEAVRKIYPLSPAEVR